MAHFHGRLTDGKAACDSTRNGTKATGLQATVASFSGAVRVNLYHLDGVDCARVALVPWMGEGVERLLYEGPVSGAPP